MAVSQFRIKVSPLSHEDTVKLALFAVCDPVSPVMVTVDPAARLKLAVNETVNVLVAPGTGVLCWIDFRLKLGTSTVWCRVVSLCQSTARAHARAQCVCVCVCVKKGVGAFVKGGVD